MGCRFAQRVFSLTGLCRHIGNASLRLGLAQTRSGGHERGQIGLVRTRKLLPSESPDEDTLGFCSYGSIARVRTNPARSKEGIDEVPIGISKCTFCCISR